MNGGWYKRGDEIKDDDFKSSNPIYKKLPEFWLTEGKANARNILFIDDPNFFVNRITLKIGEDFVTFTSRGEDDPAIAKGYRPTPCMVHTIFDLTPFTDKKGAERKYSKKLYFVKGKDSRDRLEERRANSGGTLVGIKMKIMRPGEKSPNSGNDLQVLGKVDLAKMNLPAEDLKPFDYMEMLVPPTIQQIEAALKYAAPPNNNKKKSKTVSRDSLDSADPFATEGGSVPGESLVADSNFGPEPGFDSTDEIPF